MIVGSIDCVQDVCAEVEDELEGTIKKMKLAIQNNHGANTYDNLKVILGLNLALII